MALSPANEALLADVGSRLRQARNQRRISLTELAKATGISKSTLSRLETGQRKPSLELLLPIAQAHNTSLDKLVGAPEADDPRFLPRPRSRNGRMVVPLTHARSHIQAWKVIIPPERKELELRSHEGHEWLFVLSGRMRLIVGEHEATFGPGEAAEFETRVPHWFGPVGHDPIEVLSLHGSRGHRVNATVVPTD